MPPSEDFRIVTVETGRTKPVNPWDGVQYTIEADGSISIDSTTVPAAGMIFVPVFVIGEDITVDVIRYLLDASRPAMDRLKRTAWDEGKERILDERFILPPTRDPEWLYTPTIPPIQDDISLPFRGWSFSDVFAAWIGKDKATLENGVQPFRYLDSGAGKPRIWTRRAFLVLDKETMATPDEPTGLVAVLDPASSDEQDLEFIRCDLPTTLRLMYLLEQGTAYNVDYFKRRLADDDGVIRYDRYEDFFKPDGIADQEGLLGLED